jgi:hypothetical protein
MSTFGTCLIVDPVIGDITPELTYAVQTGAAQKTAQSFQATSASNSSIVFSIQVPSENIVVDRAVSVSAQVYLTINIGSAAAGANVPPGELAFNLGLTDSLQAFPLNKLFTTCQATINNVSVSSNEQDIVDALLRMNNSRELYRYNSTTTSLPDQAYLNYQDAVLANNNPLASYNTASYDLDQIPRGAFPVQVGLPALGFPIIHHIATGGTDDSLVSTDIDDWWTIPIAFTTIEPLLTLSPFTWCDPEYNAQGLVGINNMSFNFTIDNSCKRVWSSAFEYGGPYSVSLGVSGLNNNNPFQNVQMLFEFLSTQPTQLVASKNVCPYYDYARYISNANGGVTFNQGVPAQFTSNTIQINQIPDYFIVFARIPMAQQTILDSASFLTINNVSVNFNNASGLLSSFSQNQLWNMSRKAGLNMSFDEWRGTSIRNSVDGVGEFIYTTGSILVIDAASLSLPSYLVAGNLGNFQFQITLNMTSYYAGAVQPELVIITANSGIFVTEQGTSTTFTGILTKELTLSTQEQKDTPAISRVTDERLVGGKMLHRGIARHPKYVAQHMKKMMTGAGYVSGVSGAGYTPPPTGGMMHRKSKLHKLIR